MKTTIYSLNAEETEAFNKFKEKHYKKCGSSVGVTFHQTGIGVAAEVFCDKCHKTKNITDYSCW